MDLSFFFIIYNALDSYFVAIKTLIYFHLSRYPYQVLEDFKISWADPTPTCPNSYLVHRLNSFPFSPRFGFTTMANQGVFFTLRVFKNSFSPTFITLDACWISFLSSGRGLMVYSFPFLEMM